MLLYILRTCRAPSGLVRERVLIPQKKKKKRRREEENCCKSKREKRLTYPNKKQVNGFYFTIFYKKNVSGQFRIQEW